MLAWTIIGLPALLLAVATAAALLRASRLGRAVDEVRLTVQLVGRRFALERAALLRQWWTVLGVARSASALEIDAAYRARLKETHPDLGGRGGAERIAQLRAARQAALNRREPARR